MLLRLASLAEMFAMRYLIELGQLEGEFRQEPEPPWHLWFQVKTSSLADPAAFSLFQARGLDQLAAQVAEPPPPPADLKPVNWVKVLRTFILRPAPDGRLGDEIILVTGEQAILFETVRQHFLIQQGHLEFACYRFDPPIYAIRIDRPSRWVLDRLPQDGTWRQFNQVEGQPGFYVEAGWVLSDPRNGLRLSQLKLPENTHLLIQGDGGLLSFRPQWQHASTIIEVACPAPDQPQINETGRLTIVPRLRQTDAPAPHELWRVADPARLQAILANEASRHFHGFSAWFTRQGEIWVLAVSAQADRGLATIFSDAFPAYQRLEGRVFLPAGRRLLPRLPEHRLCELFQCPPGDHLVIEGEDAALHAILLPAGRARPLDEFIAFQAEIAFTRVDPYVSAWTFDFPDVKKNA
ncbi:MAG: hypothetical protein OZSIB_0792 [Candidatus Ozemobacter sibiricus]|jgi:hypothetical protein|uniref:FtsH ternary system domain-containing protein n=1 Tax=Candidatus Ozemobacter sibiricus TaxID=2268124 RepID=A0A367ZU45_9BACT|nr:MAG: hypothetical protein OZSIB_0792 [Candidatus Ozemobacter sibiricus]